MEGLRLHTKGGYRRASRASVLARLKALGGVLVGDSVEKADLPLVSANGRESGRYPDPEVEFFVPAIDIDVLAHGQQQQLAPWGLDGAGHDAWAQSLGGTGITGFHATVWLVGDCLERYGCLPGVFKTQQEMLRPPDPINWYNWRGNPHDGKNKKLFFKHRYAALDATSYIIRTSTPVPGQPGVAMALNLYAPVHNGFYVCAIKGGGNSRTWAIPDIRNKKKK